MLEGFANSLAESHPHFLAGLVFFQNRDVSCYWGAVGGVSGCVSVCLMSTGAR